MYGKLIIKGELEIITGLHIGGSDAFSAIGAIDSPVIKDKLTGLPIIPGSSIKGKMRTLLARSVSDSVKLGSSDQDPEEIKRLFGTGGNNITKARLQFADCFLSNNNKLDNHELTEAKFENTIDRSNSTANPRQIERVVRGSIFEFRLVYDIENEQEILEDISNLAKGLKLIQLDYLGGHGTRGYGRVGFNKLSIVEIENKVDKSTMETINSRLKDVENYGILSI